VGSLYSPTERRFNDVQAASDRGNSAAPHAGIISKVLPISELLHPPRKTCFYSSNFLTRYHRITSVALASNTDPHSTLPRHVAPVGLESVQQGQARASASLGAMSSADAAQMEHASMADVARNRNIQSHASSHTLSKSPKEPAVCPTDQEAVAPKAQMNSLEYVWKSGVAGGLAGCAVSY
jgi:hypothetical protein